MKVAAVIVTRGDVDLAPCLTTIPEEWEVVVWDNSGGPMPPKWWKGWESRRPILWCGIHDLSVYGRYAASERVGADLIYVQDDDVIVSDPQAIVDAWQPGHVVCNMPPQFRHDGYTDSALVGFGACFERDLPERAFERMSGHTFEGITEAEATWPSEFFLRTCDVVFTTLTPRILVDVPKADREFASAPNRMWKQPGHYAERTRMLQLARQVRDAVPA